MPTSRRRVLLWTLPAVLVVLLALRLALPYIARHELNAKMDRMGDYHGHVDDVDLHLWRGGYDLNGLHISKVGGKVPVHLLDTPSMQVHVSWHDLWHGAVRARVHFIRPKLNFVDGKSKKDTQAGRGVNWRQAIQHLVPIRLDEVDVDDGTVTFSNFISHPRVDLHATHVQATINNLTNADRSDGQRVARFRATARLLGDARLSSHAQFDPLGHLQDFTFDLRVLQVHLEKANALARAYAGLDFASGHGDFVMQLNAKDGRLHGYAKPLFKNMQIFSWKQDVESGRHNLLDAAWQAIAQGVTSVFKNQKKNQFATRVPIDGNINAKKIGTFRAIMNVLHNAFVKAYTPNLKRLKPAPDKKP